MYQLSEIDTVHLEVTTRCNASCPMCLRNVLGGKVNPQLPLVELSVDDIQKIFPESFLRSLNRFYMCGNYGDPIAASETIEIFSHLRAVNPSLQLEMFTNGSGRDETWWRKLAELGVRVRFGIDGLEETNSIYRRGTKFNLILRSVKAFVAAGGRADWDFIVFRHNEHQIDEARQRAHELGFKNFNVKKTARFFSNVRAAVKTQQEVLSSSGEIEYYLEQPTNPIHVNKALGREDEIVERFGSLKNFFAQTPVDCKVTKEKSLYVSAEGLAFPCCWTANQLYPWYYAARTTPIWKLIEALPEGLNSLNAKIHPLDEILNGPFFQKSIPESWDKTSIESGRLFVCGKTCGKGFDAFKEQFQ